MQSPSYPGATHPAGHVDFPWTDARRAFGILSHEVFTCAETPYADLTNDVVWLKVRLWPACPTSTGHPALQGRPRLASLLDSVVPARASFAVFVSRCFCPATPSRHHGHPYASAHSKRTFTFTLLGQGGIPPAVP